MKLLVSYFFLPKLLNIELLLYIICLLGLLNLRGSDIEYNPVFFSYIIITSKDVHLFIDETKVTPVVKSHLKSEGLDVVIHPYEKIQGFLFDLVEKENGPIWIPHNSNYSLVSMIPEKRRCTQVSPVALLKAIKNEVEAQGNLK